MKPVLSHDIGFAVPLAMLLAASGCVAQVPVERDAEPVRVSNNGQPFQMWDGALARKAADAACGGKVRVSIYDRFDRATGEWVYPEGCA
jgi:hypothetical protein